MYMNAVDIVDQRRRVLVTARKGKIYMSFYTMILDLAVNNAYTLYRWLSDNTNCIEKNNRIY